MLGIHISSITRRKTKRSTFHVRDLLCNKTIKRFVRGAHGEVETESQSRIEKEREREREREREKTESLAGLIQHFSSNQIIDLFFFRYTFKAHD